MAPSSNNKRARESYGEEGCREKGKFPQEKRTGKRGAPSPLSMKERGEGAISCKIDV
jgi:hypothetical protein